MWLNSITRVWKRNMAERDKKEDSLEGVVGL